MSEDSYYTGVPGDVRALELVAKMREINSGENTKEACEESDRRTTELLDSFTSYELKRFVFSLTAMVSTVLPGNTLEVKLQLARAWALARGLGEVTK